MTLHNPSNPSNAFVRFMRQVYYPIGFKKGYNFILWFICAGAMTGFVLSRLQYLSIDGIFKAGSAPGEWYYYSKKFYHFGITLHLSTILPAGLLAMLQFTPFIRYKALIFHRINGYIVVLLLLLGNVGALMIARHAFGGTLSTQLLVGVLAIATTSSATLSYYNIKMLQIDQHRAWMLRCWFYAGSIITLRIILIITALIISRLDSFNIAISCDQIAFSSGDEAAAVYPGCNVTADGVWTGYTAVHASFGKSLIETAAAFQLSFGMAGWLAFLLHAIGVELYLNLTPAESERLRRVSYERQLERGFSHPGSAGLTVDRLGDAEQWMPPATNPDTKALKDSESETK
ncbi:Hypothetical protein R9X50_00760300 [Acrodontium crateriforme]|uniref:Microtubule associated protein n=1 Tax=Acrodontium crateriforme TaxID=150365 RepID=A0AAQ3RCU4_9PEZI|nr:Hypothetical protein R9X50_00760300 [Acrodontium crateriforme]